MTAERRLPFLKLFLKLAAIVIAVRLASFIIFVTILPKLGWAGLLFAHIVGAPFLPEYWLIDELNLFFLQSPYGYFVAYAVGSNAIAIFLATILARVKSNNWSKRQRLIVDALLCFVLGVSALCYTSIGYVEIHWDLSQSKNSSHLSHGKWIGKNSGFEQDRYYVDGNRRHSLSIATEQGEYDFNQVSSISVHCVNAEIASISIHIVNQPFDEALELLKEMHQQWDGRGVEHLEEWLANHDGKDFGRRNTIIQSGSTQIGPSITAAIFALGTAPDCQASVQCNFSWR